MIRISIRPTGEARRIAERASLTALVFLAVLSLTAAVEHIRVADVPVAVAGRTNHPRPRTAAARLTAPVHPAPPLPPVIASLPAAAIQRTPPVPPVAAVPPAVPFERIAEDLHPVHAAQTKTPESHAAQAPATKTVELPQMARIVPRMRDTSSGEADRNLPAPGVATVTGRHKDVPMLRDDAALETWGGEFAGGDSRLNEMIQAGALTSVAKGTRVRVLEVRGPLTHIEIVGQNRAGWIRSTCIVR